MTNTTEITGFLLINKASGPTSHDVVNSLRRVTGIRKIGHAGTLDPLASGLLICAIGRAATKQIDLFVKQSKIYEAEAILGSVSDTYDSQGIIVQNNVETIDENDVKKVLSKFIGQQNQIPPMYSAKKVQGKKLYELARQGIEIERQPCVITISSIELLHYQWPSLKIRIACSTGTYIRSLVHDIGRELGTGAYMSALVRTSIGKFKLADAIELQNITSKNWSQFLLSPVINE